VSSTEFNTDQHNLNSTRLNNDRMKSSTEVFNFNTAWRMETQHSLYIMKSCTSPLLHRCFSTFHFFTLHYSLHHFSLPTFHFFTLRFSLSTFHSPLSTFHCPLFTSRCFSTFHFTTFHFTAFHFPLSTFSLSAFQGMKRVETIRASEYVLLP